MSHDAMLWALMDAPTATVAEVAIVVALAERASPDGCGAFPSRTWLAQRTKLDPKVVRRNLVELERRGVIREGDQSLAAYIRADRRPPVWDLAIPVAWYASDRLAKINEDRVRNGLDQLTPQNRPPLDAAPEKAKRSDLGKPRPKKKPAEIGTEAEAASDGEPVDNSGPGNSESPREAPRGDSESRGEGARGDSKFRTGGLSVPYEGTQSPPNLKEEPSHEPSLSHVDQHEATTGTGKAESERENNPPQQPSPPNPADVITDAYAKACANAGQPASASRLQLIHNQAAEILAAGNEPGPLAMVAAWMGATNPGWRDLDWARTAPGAPGAPLKMPPRVPQQRAQPERRPCKPGDDKTRECDSHDHDLCDTSGMLVDSDAGIRCPCWTAGF